MEFNLIFVAIYLLIMAFAGWRVWVEVSHKMVLGQSATYLVYMTAYAVIWMIRWITPVWPEALHAAVLVVWVIACGVVSYKIHRKYNQWLDAEREKENQ